MKKDKKPYNPAAYPLFGIRLSPHPLQFIVMSHLRVQFVLHLFKEVGATVAFPAFDVRIEAVAVFGLHTDTPPHNSLMHSIHISYIRYTESHFLYKSRKEIG